jgi:signal transduction histidine kinase
VDVALLVNETLGSFRTSAEAGGVRLREEVTEGLAPVEADPARIRMVLANLLSNAIRHTPRGGTVTVGAIETGEVVELSVADTGTGIPEELMPRVFDRFVRGPGSRGSGLGLAIARDLVAAHGGNIEADSHPDTGTTIRFTLPRN